MTRITRTCALLVPLAFITLMSMAAHAEDEPTSPPKPSDAEHDCIAPGTWFDPLHKQKLNTPEALARMKDARVVLLGETHSIPDHHRWQMQTVAQLYAQRPNMILGFESFPRRVQPVLDDWVAGKLTQAEFLKKSEWETVWRFDANLYLPLFHFARMNKIPMVALNVDRSLINQVSQKGWEAVPETERRGIHDPAPPAKGYLEMLGEAFGQHRNGHSEHKTSTTGGEHEAAPTSPNLSDPHFAHFVDAQLTWDRAMAEAAASALKTARDQDRNPQLIGIMGRGHLDFGYGVPHQLADLGVNSVMVLTPWDNKMRSCDDLDQKPPPADLAYGLATTKDYLPDDVSHPKLGVIIERAEGGIKVIDVVKDSVAQTAKLKTGDVIVRAAGQPLVKIGDLVSIVKAMNPGTWLPLTVKRNGKEMDIVAKFPAPKP
jgi:uncharacterized iron-regulated protein